MTSSSDRDRIVETVTRMAVLADDRRWAELGGIVADERLIDAVTMTPRWETGDRTLVFPA